MHDNGTLQLEIDPDRTAVSFVDIDVAVDKAPLKPVYDALLSVFHGQIVDRITARLNRALKRKVPRQVNTLLAQVPTQVRSDQPCDPGSRSSTSRVSEDVAGS